MHRYLSIRYLRYLCFDIRKMITNNYLFVYGTLLDDGNEFAIYLKNNCSFYAEGRFKAGYMTLENIRERLRMVIVRGMFMGVFTS